jgi:hypothetical protein
MSVFYCSRVPQQTTKKIVKKSVFYDDLENLKRPAKRRLRPRNNRGTDTKDLGELRGNFLNYKII